MTHEPESLRGSLVRPGVVATMEENGREVVITISREDGRAVNIADMQLALASCRANGYVMLDMSVSEDRRSSRHRAVPGISMTGVVRRVVVRQDEILFTLDTQGMLVDHHADESDVHVFPTSTIAGSGLAATMTTRGDQVSIVYRIEADGERVPVRFENQGASDLRVYDRFSAVRPG